MSKKKRGVLMACALLAAAVLMAAALFPSGQQQPEDISLNATPADVSLNEMISPSDRQPAPSDANTAVPIPPADSSQDNREEIERIKRQIEENERQQSAAVQSIAADAGTDRSAADLAAAEKAAEEKTDRIFGRERTKKKRTRKPKKDSLSVPAAPAEKSVFNSVSLHRDVATNAVRAYVYSTQTVGIGSTLKMRLGEDSYTQDGVKLRRNSLVYGTVTKIDGERVIVRISSVNVGGNILPYRKEVYSQDALKGIYVPGNEKSDTKKDLESGAVDGINITPGMTGNAGLDIAGNVVGAVAGAGKKAAHRRIEKIRVTIKTNYTVYLMPVKDRADDDGEYTEE